MQGEAPLKTAGRAQDAAFLRVGDERTLDPWRGRTGTDEKVKAQKDMHINKYERGDCS